MRENQLGATQHCDHLCIHSKIIDSAAWCSLSYASQSLYVLLRRKLLESNNGHISATLGDLKHYGWNSSATLAKALKELRNLCISPQRMCLHMRAGCGSIPAYAAI